MTHPKQEVRIGNYVYASHGEAARALGVTRQAVDKAVAEGRVETLGLRKDGQRVQSRKPVSLAKINFKVVE